MKKMVWFFLSFLVLLFDQISKHWILTHLNSYQENALFPMLNFTLTYNTGSAFGFLQQAGNWHQWFFVGFSSAMCCALAIWLIRIPHTLKRRACAISLILGGALGNLYDRLTIGHVIDFIDFYYKNYHWPAFNLADSAICIGAVILLIEL